MHIGPWFLHIYTLRIVLGTLSGLIWLWFRGPRRGFPRLRLAGLLWSVMIGAWLLGRAGYVLQELPYFQQHPAQGLQTWQVGGWHGSAAWIGGLLATWIWARWTHTPWSATLTLLAPAVLLITAGAWWGCADRGCAWGQPVLTPPAWLQWAVRDGPDIYWTVAPRYAVQLLAAGGALSMAALAMVLGRWNILAVALYLGGAAMLTGLRGDPALLLGGYRLDFLLSGGLALLFLMVQLRSALQKTAGASGTLCMIGTG